VISLLPFGSRPGTSLERAGLVDPTDSEEAAMFDAKKLLDALVGAAAQIGQTPTEGHGQREPGSSQGQPARTGGGGEPSLAGQVDQTLKQVTGLGTDELVQKAKDTIAQHPTLAPAVMLALAGMFTSKRKTGRAIPGGLARLGGLALIGTLAYKAYQNRQAGKPLLDLGGLAGALGSQGQEGGTGSQAALTHEPEAGGSAPGQGARAKPSSEAGEGGARTFHALDLPEKSGFHPAEQSEDDILLFLRAMVAAASADGHIDQAERNLIVKGLSEAGIDSEATRWLEREMESPADVEELAAPVSTPEKAAQVYAAARIAIDPDTIQEREFLRQLAESLDLDQATKAQVDDTADALKGSA
jgi:uncharacterized membrane protein YebE (DUF533 family)